MIIISIIFIINWNNFLSMTWSPELYTIDLLLLLGYSVHDNNEDKIFTSLTTY